MMKRRAIFAVCALFALPLLARADEFSNNIGSNLNSTSLDALAKDLGALIGGASFHSGNSLGFPVGFDLGFHMDGADLDSKDAILRDDHSFATASWGQAEIGLPGRLNVLARYGKIDRADIYGGGLRYALLKSDVPGVPSLSVSGLYNQIVDDVIKGHVVTGNLVASFDVPILHPYIGAGYDYTQIDPKGKAFDAAPAGADRGVDGHASGYRVEAGVNVSLIPFTYITLGGGVANGQKMGHAGAGIRF